MSFPVPIDINSICLKITGESLMSGGDPLSSQSIQFVVEQIEQIISRNIKLCLVLGGGNIYRGQLGKNIGADPILSDQIGMMATIINALALFEALNRKKIPCSIYSSTLVQGVVREFDYIQAKNDFNSFRVVIFCAGLGHPFFTTDTACVLRALEMEVDLLMKGTKVDGIYDKDPLQFKDAKKYDVISYKQALESNLNIMDSTAFSLCLEKNLPLIVFNFFKNNALSNILDKKKQEGTLVLPSKMFYNFNLQGSL